MIKFADCKGGFPHSEIFGSQGARASPKLIAACHVLHRLSTPRHPSEALMRLIVLSKTHVWGSVDAWPAVRRTGHAPTHALRYFVFADNDVFSDPSWCFVSAWGGGRRPDRPFNSRCQICRRRPRAGTESRFSAIAREELDGGARRDRTDDLMLAKHALYQLSYGPSFKKPASAGSTPYPG